MANPIITTKFVVMRDCCTDNGCIACAEQIRLNPGVQPIRQRIRDGVFNNHKAALVAADVWASHNAKVVRIKQ